MTHVLLLLACMTPSSLANDGVEEAVQIEAQFGVNWEPEPTPAAFVYLGWGEGHQLLAVDVEGRVWTRENRHRWVALGGGLRQGAPSAIGLVQLMRQRTHAVRNAEGCNRKTITPPLPHAEHTSAPF